MTQVTETLICITCPMGCSLEVTHEGDTVLSVEGNTCNRGLAYVERELTDPRRMVATTVRVKEGLHPLVPVYTQAPFPKPLIFDLLAEIRNLRSRPPCIRTRLSFMMPWAPALTWLPAARCRDNRHSGPQGVPHNERRQNDVHATTDETDRPGI